MNKLFKILFFGFIFFGLGILMPIAFTLAFYLIIKK
jgi:hypothetical protein